jgi:octopine/nopaline transport system substrate-binding protein
MGAGNGIMALAVGLIGQLGSMLAGAKRASYVLALGASAILATSAAHAQQAIKIATEGTYPPWTFSDNNGGVQGFEVDLAHDACRRLALQCELVIQDFPGFIPGLLAGKFDVVLSALVITEERKKVVDFTRPYAVTLNGFAVAKDSDLAKMPFGGQRFSLDAQTSARKKPSIK